MRLPRLVFGLKWKRLKEWRAVLEEEGKTVSYWHMFCELCNTVLYPINPSRYKMRLRICQRCPLYDKSLKRCRPFTGASQGCGCYMPYRAQSPTPCYLNQIHPDQGWN